MKTINKLIYIISTAILTLVLCIAFKINLEYSTPILSILIVTLSVLFILNAFYTKKSKQ